MADPLWPHPCEMAIAYTVLEAELTNGGTAKVEFSRRIAALGQTKNGRDVTVYRCF